MKIQYVLTGFSHDLGYRVFAFEGIDEDRGRTAFRVRADLALARKHHIAVQELPLLCRTLLERRESTDARRAYTFEEGEMREHAERCAARHAEAAQKRRPPAPSSSNNGAAWRAPKP